MQISFKAPVTFSGVGGIYPLRHVLTPSIPLLRSSGGLLFSLEKMFPHLLLVALQIFLLSVQIPLLVVG